MPDIEILKWFAYLIGAILLAGSISSVIGKWLGPFRSLNKEVKELKQFETEARSSLEDICKSNHLVCKAVVTLLEHEITGNHVEALQKCNEDIRNYLIDKS